MKTLAIIGVGALGSHAALLLRNAGRLKLVDFDRVEARNVLGQLHTKMSVGRNKAVALAQHVAGSYGVKVEANPYKLRADNVHVILNGSDLVIDTTDNYEARSLICGAWPPATCLHGCLDATGTFGRVVWGDHGFVPDAEGTPGQATCEAGEQLPFFALTAAVLAAEAQRFLGGNERRSWDVSASGVRRVS